MPVTSSLLLNKRVYEDILDNIFKFSNGSKTVGEIGTVDGILLLVLFIGFIAWTVSYALKERTNEEEAEDIMSKGKCALFIIGGVTAIMIGGNLVVDSAKSLALAAGMTETLVGLTVVALGTSLPELVTSIVAARKGEADLAVGNVVGSNISNILLVLGVSAAISPVSVTMMNAIDGMVALVVTIIVFIMSGTNRTIRKKEGVFFIFVYVLYMVYIICRQYIAW